MVIASSGWIQNVSDSNHEKIMSATGILVCHDNSYPFQERTLSLEQPIKIGRSVARARAANDNAIFDCKVLSRNHALLWYDAGKFYLKDTKSSNGTFVNNKRLSPSGEESIACEVCSGDVVQFGVDVVESTKKVTHGCIVATLKLYLPDGKEAKASFSNSVAYVNVTLEDLYKLNQFIQEAGRRENALRSKLEYMQQLLEHTKVAATQSWKALVVEDCLLSRLEMLENQVLAYSKNFVEDKLRTELINSIEDKAQYQNATKELLKKKVQEKKETINKIKILKSRLSEAEDETQSLHNIIKNHQSELQELAIKYLKTQQVLQDTTDRLNKTKIKLNETVEESEKEKQEYEKKLGNQLDIEKRLQISLKDSKLNLAFMYKQISTLQNYLKILLDINYINGETSSLNTANPIDAINIMLSKWNSFYTEISKNNQIDNNEETDLINKNYKPKYYTNDNSIKNDLHSNLFILENKRCKYVLPPISNKTIFMANEILNSKNKFYSADSYCFSNKSELDITKTGKKFVFSQSGDHNNHDSISSLKLFMKFSNKTENNVDNTSLNTCFQSIYDCFDSKNDCYSSSFMHKKTQEINRTNEDNKDILSTIDLENNSKIENNCLQINNLICTIKPLVQNNLILNKCSQEFMLKNLIRSKYLLDKQSITKQNSIKEELQDLKNWLLHEPNEVIIEILKNSYYHFENETQQVQELKEHLVILKEKYNVTMEEKANAVRKCAVLEAQCKKFLSNACISIYYVVPIIFALIWMLFERLL